MKHKHNHHTPKISKSTSTFAVLVICVAVVVTARVFTRHAAGQVKIKAAQNRVKGNPKGSIRIVEYLDFQCPACARGALMLKSYLQKYPLLIFLEVKYFPIQKIHAHAMTSAVYAECAARQNKFWAFQDVLVERQAQWAKLISAEDVFKNMAKESGLDISKLESCLADERVRALILNEKVAGKALGVDSTPTYFINGKIAVGTKSLTEELDKYLGASH